MSPTPQNRRPLRAVLVTGVVAGLITLTTLPLLQPEQLGLASDVYYHAAQAALAGEDLYAAEPSHLPGYRFLYPPIVVLVFVPHALTGSATAAHAIQTVANVAVIAALAWVVLRALDRRGVALERVDRALVVAFVALSTWTTSHLVMGQTTPWLAIAIAVGLDALERERETLAGVAFALAALVKVFPAVLGAWLLRRRAWSAVAAALATGLGGLALGALLLGPDATVHYLTEVLVGRHEAKAFGATPDPSVNRTTARRQIAALLGGDHPLVTPLAIATVAPAVAYCYRRVDDDRHRLAAVVATIAGTFLVMPLQPLYYVLLVYPLLVLLFVLPAGRERALLLAGTALTFLQVKQDLLEQSLAPLPDALTAPLLDATRVAFTVVLPPTIGTWLLLLGAVAVQRRRWALADAPPTDGTASSASDAGSFAAGDATRSGPDD